MTDTDVTPTGPAAAARDTSAAGARVSMMFGLWLG